MLTEDDMLRIRSESNILGAKLDLVIQAFVQERVDEPNFNIVLNAVTNTMMNVHAKSIKWAAENSKFTPEQAIAMAVSGYRDTLRCNFGMIARFSRMHNSPDDVEKLVILEREYERLASTRFHN